MAGQLSGKTALITGGSRGIGAATAIRFADEGASLAITYSGNKAAADRTVSAITSLGGKAMAIQADAAQSHAVRAAVEAASDYLGGLDIIVHSAGVFQSEEIADAKEETYRDHFGVNVKGVFVSTTAALKHMRDKGRIIVIGSVNAHTMPWTGGAIYGASKAAVAGLARGWARDLGARGITVNVIQPGPIATEMNPDDGRDAAKYMISLTALGRYGKPEEIAALAAFLASDDASFITGATIDIDGGLSI